MLNKIYIYIFFLPKPVSDFLKTYVSSEQNLSPCKKHIGKLELAIRSIHV